jgi:hypothetical protein
MGAVLAACVPALAQTIALPDAELPPPAAAALPVPYSTSPAVSPVQYVAPHAAAASCGPNGCGGPACGASCGTPCCGPTGCSNGCNTGCCGSKGWGRKTCDGDGCEETWWWEKMCGNWGAFNWCDFACTALMPYTSACPWADCERTLLWGDFEYLIWWMRNGNMTATLATTGGPAGLGVLGAPSTVPLTSDQINFNAQSGIRLTLGGWLATDSSLGFEGRVFWLEQEGIGNDFISNAAGVPLINSPYTNALNGLQGGQLSAFPGLAAGGVSFSADTKLWGAELNLAARRRGGPWWSRCRRGCTWTRPSSSVTAI